MLLRNVQILCLAICLLYSQAVGAQSDTIVDKKTSDSKSSNDKQVETKQKEGTPPPNEEKAALSDSRLVIKNGKEFLILDPQGMISGRGAGGFGLYSDDTRYLSNWELYTDGLKPKLLSASVKEGFAGNFIYSNFRLPHAQEGALLIQRELTIRGALFEKLTVTNYSTERQTTNLQINIDSDFADMFEVRGSTRKKRGTAQPVVLEPNSALYSYIGLDGIPMSCKISSAGKNANQVDLKSGVISIPVDLAAGQSQSYEFVVQAKLNDEKLKALTELGSYSEQIKSNRDDFEKWRQSCASIQSDNVLLNTIFDQAIRDLYILRQPTPRGWCISAGLPWFAVAFGRDELITGLQTLPVAPQIAYDVLNVLANYQGKKDDPFTEERKGKIMHELRLGEMARCREIPFIPYYGTVDATPLFLVLIGRYTDWTGDDSLARKLWPNVKDALDYLESARQGGYLSYGGAGALSNQGWKDSGDSVMYSNGELAKAPIALCEVQAYLYEGWRSASKLAKKLGDEKLSAQLDERAAKFKEKFQKDFWLADKQIVALALDGNGKACDVLTSNAGHVIGTGILEPAQDSMVADRLGQDDMFCGWGVRTLSSKEKRYNPMSYHDGSVWPHDNGMIVSGMARAGKYQLAGQVMDGILSAAQYQSNARLPELFCGFSKSQFSEPVPYPVSCSPQAWAAGSMLQMIMANLHLSVDQNGAMHVGQTSLPASIGSLTLRGLHVGNGSADVLFRQEKERRRIEIIEKRNNANIIVD